MALINLPWASFRRPSIQIGLLGAIARDAGHEVELAHLNLDLAAEVGAALYDLVSEHRSTALGDWLFARAAFQDDAPPAAAFLEDQGAVVRELLGRLRSEVELTDIVAFHREGAEAFLRGQIARHDWSGVQVFGLTSTFQQNTACFAMARLLKASYPNAVVIAGGANFDGEMGPEWLKAVDSLDYVVSGEADEAFPLLLEALATGARVQDVPNLLFRDGGEVVRTASAKPFRDLDKLPPPDYSEYFSRAERLKLLRVGARLEVDLPIETSRGCWWGERRHCTFCGLNGETMAFRSKSPDRVMGELAQLAHRHRSYRFSAVDNIADNRFFKTLFPALAEQGTTYNLFYEVKSGLNPERLQQLRAAGVVRIQPGIESLSTRVLGLMQKGVRAIANVNLLRWAALLDIDVSWNLIWGFPGETEADYREQAALLPQLWHLQPPLGAGRIWLERFSPLFETRRASAPELRPEASLRQVYPATTDLTRAAYFFEYDFDTEVPADAYGEVAAAVNAWQAARNETPPPRLEFRNSDGFLQIDDARVGEGGIFTYEDGFARLYLAMSRIPRPIGELRREAGLAEGDFDAALDEFCGRGLAMRDGDHLLALALPHRPPGRRP